MSAAIASLHKSTNGYLKLPRAVLAYRDRQANPALRAVITWLWTKGYQKASSVVARFRYDQLQRHLADLGHKVPCTRHLYRWLSQLAADGMLDTVRQLNQRDRCLTVSLAFWNDKKKGLDLWHFLTGKPMSDSMSDSRSASAKASPTGRQQPMSDSMSDSKKEPFFKRAVAAATAFMNNGTGSGTSTVAMEHRAKLAQLRKTM